MSKFRFVIERQETRRGIMIVEAETFEAATTIAAKIADLKVPRGAFMRESFNSDNTPDVEFVITNGREL